jgi:hypothetical protein
VFGRSVRGRARAVEFSGQFEHSQVVVGEHNTLNRYEGTVVQVLPAGTVLTPEPQPRPQTRLPRPGPEPLGRERELGMIREALARGQSTEFYGPPGIGKTALLAHVARAPGAAWADGVVHARVGGQPVEDVLQWLFEVFWTTKPRWAPGPLRIREYLRQLRVLVVLDDVEFSADDATALLDAVEHSTILIGGIEPHLDPTARAVALAGLPVDAAVAAYARCLRRSLDRSEERAVAQLVERLGFVPALVLDAARMIRDGVCQLADLSADPEGALDRHRILPLSDAQRRLLALLAELAPAAVPAELFAGAAATVSDAEALERRDLAEANSPRYALARPLTARARGELPAPDAAELLQLLANEADGQQLTDDAAPAVSAALQWGARAGALDAVIDTARLVDGLLLRAGRTGAWGMAIECGAAAAGERGRELDEAYFLHQAGTRWLCLGEQDRAETQLRRALALREKLGDNAGIAATRHNLDVLYSGRGAWPGGADGGGGNGGGPALPTSVARWMLGLLAAAAAGVGLGVLVAGGGSTPTATVTHAVTPITLRPRTVTSTAAGPGATRVTGPGSTVTRTVPATTTSTSTTVTTTTTTQTSTTVTTSTSTTVTTSTTTTTIIK